MIVHFSPGSAGRSALAVVWHHVLIIEFCASHCYLLLQVTKEQYKEMIERRRAELPAPLPLPVNTDAPAAPSSEEGDSPKLSPKERMDANW